MEVVDGYPKVRPRLPAPGIVAFQTGPAKHFHGKTEPRPGRSRLALWSRFYMFKNCGLTPAPHNLMLEDEPESQSKCGNKRQVIGGEEGQPGSI